MATPDAAKCAGDLVTNGRDSKSSGNCNQGSSHLIAKICFQNLPPLALGVLPKKQRAARRENVASVRITTKAQIALVTGPLL